MISEYVEHATYNEVVKVLDQSGLDPGGGGNPPNLKNQHENRAKSLNSKSKGMLFSLLSTSSCFILNSAVWPKALYHLAVIFESFHLKMGT